MAVLDENAQRRGAKGGEVGVIYIGIDPGKHGAYAIIDEDGTVQVHPWDNTKFIKDMVRVCFYDNDLCENRHVACVEKVSARPGQGTVSMFSFGKSAGFIEGVLMALGIPYQLVPPATWKKAFSLIGKDKAASIETCRKLFPGVDLKPSANCRKDSDGMAEAVLMAEYAKRKL